MHEHDHAEGAEAARLQPGEVIAGDVLHDAPTALHHAAVAGYERDAEQMILDRSEAVPQRARRRGRDDGAERAPGETGRINREPRAAVGELLAQLIEPDAGLGGRREVGRLDRGNPVEAAGRDREVGGSVALQPRPGAFDSYAPPFLVPGPQYQRDRVR